MKLLVLSIAILVVGFARAEHEIAELTCNANAKSHRELTSCQLTLRVDDETYAFGFTRVSSVFADDLTVAMKGSEHNGDLDLGYGRFHSIGKDLATASIAVDDANKYRVVDAIFATRKHGIIEYRANKESGKMEWKSATKEANPLRRMLQFFRSYTRNWSGSEATDPILFVDANKPSSCYPNDQIMQTARISIAADLGFYEASAGPLASNLALGRLATLQAVEGVASYAQLIWSAQLNIKLQISHVEIGTVDSDTPLNYSPNRGTCGQAFGAFYDFRSKWMPSRKNAYDWGGITMFISNCFTDTITGMADIGSFCWSSGATAVAAAFPKEFAHELGHTFGAQHSFEDGTGVTGGIMDYGSGLYQGVMQFHPYNKPELCGFLSSLKSSSKCQSLIQATDASRKMCGDGVLGPDEECECLDQSISCGTCQRCKLTAPAQCSTTFSIRTHLDRGYVRVQESTMASPECCSADGTVPSAKSCNGGEGVCTFGGFCSPICRSLGYAPCGIEPTGCRQSCNVFGLCVNSAPQMIAKGFTLNAVPDNTPCTNPATGAPGLCSNGNCLINGAPIPSTTRPTKAPTTLATLAPTQPFDCAVFGRKKAACRYPCMWCNNKVGCANTCTGDKTKNLGKKKKKKSKQKSSASSSS